MYTFPVVSINLTLSYHPPRLPLVDSCVLLISSCLLLVGRPCGLASLAMSRINQRDYPYLSPLLSSVVYPVLRSMSFSSRSPSPPPTLPSHLVTIAFWQQNPSLPLPPLVRSTDSYLTRSSLEGVINLLMLLPQTKTLLQHLFLADIWVNESDLSFSFFFYPLLCPSFLYEIHIYQWIGAYNPLWDSPLLQINDKLNFPYNIVTYW